MKTKIMTVVALAMTMAMGAYAQTEKAQPATTVAPAATQTAPVAHPTTATPNIHQRQENQQDRIAHGLKSGELTAKETKHLEKRQVKIQHDKRKAKADGTVTHAEKKKITREQNHASEAIKDQKHDTQTQH